MVSSSMLTPSNELPNPTVAPVLIKSPKTVVNTTGVPELY